MTTTPPKHAAREHPAREHPTPPPPRPKRHLPALDGLRGVAILGVLLFHTGHLSGGFLGVDLFFALSGYLITDLLLREIDATGSVSLVAFWGRRIRRLVPALSVMLALVAVAVWRFGTPDLRRSTLSDGPWTQADLVNWHLLAESANYWDQHDAPRVFEHLWSIAVEEQFYLVWPALLLVLAWCARRCGRQVERWAAAGALLISLVSLALMIALVDPHDPTRVYTGTDTRAFSLLLGAIVATRPVRTALTRAALTRTAGRYGGALAAVLASAIAVTWFLVNGTDSRWLYSGGLFAHSAAAALLISLCVQAPHSAVATTLARLPLRWAGEISYSLYLWHWPVFVLLPPQRLHLTGWPWTAVVCAVSIAVAAASKYLVEDPIRFRAGWARGRAGLLVFLAVTAGLAALWWLLPVPAAPTIDITELS